MTKVKKDFWQKAFVYIFTLVLTALSVSLPLTSVQSSTSVKTILLANSGGDNIFDKIQRFVFPPTSVARGAPTGRRKGAASRSGCPQRVLDLTALVPQNSWGLTFTEQPTFWFYVPALPQGSRSAEFNLQDENSSRQQYQTRFTLPATAGIISLSLPSQQTNLQVDHRYHWYLQVYCDPHNSSTYVFVDGTVQRVAQNANNANTIWYDLLTNSGNRLRAKPQDPQHRETWTTLLKDVGLEKLAQAPLLPCCTSEK